MNRRDFFKIAGIAAIGGGTNLLSSNCIASNKYIPSGREMISHSTIRIDVERSNGQFSKGTGFFYQFCRKDDWFIPAIVTNKHVLNDAKNVILRFTKSSDDNKPIIGSNLFVSCQNISSFVMNHPDDDVDLCIITIESFREHFMKQGSVPFMSTLDSSMILSEEEIDGLSSIENIVMIGYPSGICDEVNNMPIARRGITATSLKINYRDKPEFLVDISAIPGSSGSPILLWNTGTFIYKNDYQVGTMIKLLGVLHSTYLHKYSGEIQIVDAPTQMRPISETSIPINLGIAVRADQLKIFDKTLEPMLDSERAKRVKG